jgi:putative membrane protein
MIMMDSPFAVILLLQRQVWTVFGETVLFALLGVVMFGVAFWLIARLAPFSIRKELEQDHNTSIAIVIAAVIIGIAIIVASAIHG